MDLPALRIVLVETSHPGNIGATARAMKTMALDSLYLVRPRHFPHADAKARASGADDVLERAVVCADLDEALAGCGRVAGASARLRSLSAPPVDAREAVAALWRSAADRPAAVVFGAERTGLSNAELDRCHLLLQIPADPAFSSLNLAMAVQIVAYEWRLATGALVPPARRETPLADVAEMERLYEHLQAVMLESGFLDPANPRHLMRRLRLLFNRAELDENEVNILRGLLSAVQCSNDD